MIRLILALLICLPAWSATYYVDCAAANDLGAGTAPETAWKTLAKVQSSAFNGDDQILLKSGCVWREALAFPSSGTAGHPILIDAYGTGEPPTINGSSEHTSTGAWTFDGTRWTATQAGSNPTKVWFGSVTGTQAASAAAVDAVYKFYVGGGKLYTWTAGGAGENPYTKYGTIRVEVPYANGVLSFNGKTYVTVQHLRITQAGNATLYIYGASSNLIFANCEFSPLSESNSPSAVNIASTVTPSGHAFYNCDFIGGNYGLSLTTATSVALTNVRCILNRTKCYNLVSGSATWTTSHSWANDSSNAYAYTETTAGIDGYANGALRNGRAYPAVVSLIMDDPETRAAGYVQSIMDALATWNTANGKNWKMTLAVVTDNAIDAGASFATSLNTWRTAGHDIVSHSKTHQYYLNSSNAHQLDPMTIRYTGAGTAATVTVSGARLTTAVTGGPGNENLDIDLNAAATDTLPELVAYINNFKPNGTQIYTAVQSANYQRTANYSSYVLMNALADIAAQACKASAYTLLLDETRTWTNEWNVSKAWLEANVTGLTVTSFVYPGERTDAHTYGILATAGALGARGKPQAAATGLSDGFNVENIPSNFLSTWHTQTEAWIRGRVFALVAKSAYRGTPLALFWHDELTPTEAGYLWTALKDAGATVLTLTDQIAYVRGGVLKDAANFLWVSSATDWPTRDWRLTTPSSALRGTGTDVGATYNVDLYGKTRTVWDVGAQAFQRPRVIQ